ncbi:hypothetical protein [Cysteiniphilum litorale]|uniref:hypothetical protein n=1 Tax=Cysteiniphilum litorale TaxID=2056700 RepID=UPI003F8809C6
MELLNAIKSLGAFAVYLFNQWLGWAWYVEIITGVIIFLYCYDFRRHFGCLLKTYNA